MKKILITLFLVCSLFSEGPTAVLSNRPMAQVGGTTITLLDVVHKMNLQLVSTQPQAFDNPQMLQSYYTQYWKVALEGCIEDELLFLEGEDKKLSVKESQIQESLDQLVPMPFAKNLERINLTLAQAKILAKKSFYRRQLEGYFLYSSALLQLTPHRIKSAYIAYLNENPPEDVWQYRIVTASAKKSTLVNRKEISNDLVKTVDLSLSDFPMHPQWKTFSLVSRMESMFPPDQQFSISKPFQVTTNKLSEKYKSALSKISSGGITPLSTKKLLYLEKKMKTSVPTLDEFEKKMKNNLLNDQIQETRKPFFDDLSSTHGVIYHPLPEDFQIIVQ